MTFEIVLVLGILFSCLILFVTEQVRMDVVALMVLSSLAVFGLVSPAEAISGFSNPAVITVWAMFIMREGLTRAGIADQTGNLVMQISGRSEVRIITIFMIAAGILSAFMNNIAVAALMLPVVDRSCSTFRNCAVSSADAVGLRYITRRANDTYRHTPKPASEHCATWGW